jgi:hypothetical protein
VMVRRETAREFIFEKPPFISWSYPTPRKTQAELEVLTKAPRG